MTPRTILISAGDDSGDAHAANLMRAVRAAEPEARFVGLGMSRMSEQGLQPLDSEPEHGSTMWLKNVARLGYYRRRLALCRRRLAAGDVDLVVPVDFGGFNLYLSREATRQGVPVFYYIPPQVWAHGRYRLKKLRKWTTRCGLIYPFEARLYERWGVEAEYVGHPYFDELERRPPDPHTVDSLRGRFGECLVGLFPGSRRQEVAAHMPVLIETCRRVRARVPRASFALRCTPPTRELAEGIAAAADVEMAVLGDEVSPVELAAASRLCITKSGTITLEIAGQGTPMVIFYQASPLVAFLAWGVSHTPYVGLINVLAGRVICPEKASLRIRPDWVAGQALRLLQDEDAYESCRADIRGVLDGFARPGASERAAHSALGLLQPAGKGDTVRG